MYGLNNGIIKDLSVIHNNSEDIDPIYRYTEIKPLSADIHTKKEPLPVTEVKNSEPNRSSPSGASMQESNNNRDKINTDKSSSKKAVMEAVNS